MATALSVAPVFTHSRERSLTNRGGSNKKKNHEVSEASKLNVGCNQQRTNPVGYDRFQMGRGVVSPGLSLVGFTQGFSIRQGVWTAINTYLLLNTAVFGELTAVLNSNGAIKTAVSLLKTDELFNEY